MRQQHGLRNTLQRLNFQNSPLPWPRFQCSVSGTQSALPRSLTWPAAKPRGLLRQEFTMAFCTRPPWGAPGVSTSALWSPLCLEASPRASPLACLGFSVLISSAKTY